MAVHSEIPTIRRTGNGWMGYIDSAQLDIRQEREEGVRTNAMNRDIRATESFGEVENPVESRPRTFPERSSKFVDLTCFVFL